MAPAQISASPFLLPLDTNQKLLVPDKPASFQPHVSFGEKRGLFHPHGPGSLERGQLRVAGFQSGAAPGALGLGQEHTPAPPGLAASTSDKIHPRTATSSALAKDPMARVCSAGGRTPHGCTRPPRLPALSRGPLSLGSAAAGRTRSGTV